jgi:hypothetical protein
MPAPVGRMPGPWWTSSSIRSSAASSSLWPPGPKILMPLSGIGLCDALIITPKSAS